MMSETRFQPELLRDMLLELDRCEANSLDGNRIGQFSRNYCSGYITAIVLSLSKYLKLTHTSRCLAVEIFSRFFSKYIRDLRRQAMESSNIDDCVTDIFVRMKKQIVLRIVSCINIAYQVTTPLVSHYEIVFQQKCLSFLSCLGYPTTRRTLQKSQMRVLSVLEYKVAFPTIVTSVQVFTEVLVHNLIPLHTKMFYPLVYDVIDFWYLARHRIKRSLLRYWDSCSKRYYNFFS